MTIEANTCYEMLDSAPVRVIAVGNGIVTYVHRLSPTHQRTLPLDEFAAKVKQPVDHLFPPIPS